MAAEDYIDILEPPDDWEDDFDPLDGWYAQGLPQPSAAQQRAKHPEEWEEVAPGCFKFLADVQIKRLRQQ